MWGIKHVNIYNSLAVTITKLNTINYRDSLTTDIKEAETQAWVYRLG